MADGIERRREREGEREEYDVAFVGRWNSFGLYADGRFTHCKSHTIYTKVLGRSGGSEHVVGCEWIIRLHARARV